MNSLVDLPGEEWRPFRSYMVSNKGRVWSDRRQKLICENVSYTDCSGRPRYRMMSWRDEGEKVTRKISQLVIKLFGPENKHPDIYNCIDHIDGDIHNDSIENLRYLEGWKNRMWSNKTAGSSFHKHSGKFEAKISTPVKRFFLGGFDTPEEAAAVYFAARDRAMLLCVGDFVIRTPASIESYVKTGAW